MKVKKMPLEEFEKIQDRNWVPVVLIGDAIPQWAQSIPLEKINHVYASGCFEVPADLNYQSISIPSGELIGGIDIYRNAPDDPVELNKDWYAVVRSDQDPLMLLVDGPFKDNEHWINDIPDRLQGAEVLGVPKK